MTADAANRRTVREAFAALCVTAMEGISVDKVYSYEKSVITDKTALMILSAGSNRHKSGINDTRWINEFDYEVLTFVRKPNTFNTAQNGVNWTEQEVEDALDNIDKALADVVSTNRANSNWSYVSFDDNFSEIADGRGSSIQRDQGALGYKIERRIVRVLYVETG